MADQDCEGSLVGTDVQIKSIVVRYKLRSGSPRKPSATNGIVATFALLRGLGADRYVTKIMRH